MKTRSGFSLIEVLVALTLLGIVLLSMTSTSVRMGRTASEVSRSTVALGLVQERLSTIQMDPAYAQIEARYEGVENSIADFPDFRRETSVTAVSESVAGGRTLEYKQVTVEVDGPGIDQPISRTITIARR